MSPCSSSSALQFTAETYGGMVELTSMPDTLFGNDAPYLREYHADFLLLSMQESWLCGLHSLRSVSEVTLMNALSFMPKLEEISPTLDDVVDIIPQGFTSRTSLVMRESLSLPYL